MNRERMPADTDSHSGVGEAHEEKKGQRERKGQRTIREQGSPGRCVNSERQRCAAELDGFSGRVTGSLNLEKAMGSGLAPSSSSLGWDVNCQWDGTKEREGGGAPSLNYILSICTIQEFTTQRILGMGRGCVWLCLLYSS